MKTKFFLPCLLFFCGICLPVIVLAAAPPAPVPIDGGLSLLIAAGVGYGVKKIRDERKKKRESEEVNK
jgi:hypothetical protein